jgi:3-dehydro-L-gulonate 2-dehydrogenase
MSPSVCQGMNSRLLEENRRNGITVDDSVWAKIQSL